VDLNHGGTIEAKTNLTLKASTGNAGSDHVLVENQFTLRAGSAVTIMDDLGYPGGWLDMLALVNGTTGNVEGNGVGGTANTVLWRSYANPTSDSTNILRDNSLGWDLDNIFPSWLKIDLDRALTIDQIKIRSFYQDEKRFLLPRNVEFHCSDDINSGYSLVMAVESAKQAQNSFLFAPARKGQYWKVVVKDAWQITDILAQEGVSTGVLIERIQFHEAVSTSFGMSTFASESTPQVGWSNDSATSGATKIHGPFGNGTRYVNKTWTLPPHSQLRVQAKFWALDSWDAEDEASLQVCDGGLLNCKTWWTKRRSHTSTCAGGWTSSSADLPNPWDGDEPGHKCFYQIDITKPHVGDALQLPHDKGEMALLFGGDLDGHVGDESWGFSDVTIDLDSHGHDLTIHADFESIGDGTVSVAAGKVLSTNARPVMLTAFDIDLQGSLSLAQGLLSIHGSGPDQTIALGNPTSAADMQLSDAELGRITATSGVTVGSSTSGILRVAGVTQSSTAHVGTLTLMALRADRIVSFDTLPSSFDKGIIVRSAGGVVFDNGADFVAQGPPASEIYAGTGTLTIATSTVLSTTAQELHVVADDVDLRSNSEIQTAVMRVRGFTPDLVLTVGETGSSGMVITDDELGFIVAERLVVGDSSNGDATIGVLRSLTDPKTARLGSLHVVATKEGKSITVASDMAIRGGFEFKAGAGLTVNGDITSNGTGVLSAGTGVLTVATGKTVKTSLGGGHLLTLTADELDLAGSADSGKAAVHFRTVSPQTIGLGVAREVTISHDEVQRITSGGLAVGQSRVNQAITVQNVTYENSAAIQGVVSLIALVDGSKITFEQGSSTFYGLSTQADDGVFLDANAAATTSYVYIDGDFDDSATSDTFNKAVLLSDGTIISTPSTLTLEASGSPYEYPAVTSTGQINCKGRLTLSAGSGVTILDHVVMEATGTRHIPEYNNSYATGNELVVDADGNAAAYRAAMLQAGVDENTAAVNSVFDNRATGAGVLTVAEHKLVQNLDSAMVITAFDVDLLGSLSSGTAAISVHASRAGQSIGLGHTADMTLSDEELLRISVGGPSTSGDLLFRKAMDYNWFDNVTEAGMELRGSITVSEVSRGYTVEPDTVIFGRQWTSDQMYTVKPSISSRIAQANQKQIRTQVYDMPNDFLPLIEGWPRIDVPDMVSLGNEITITWYPDVRSERLSHAQDWVGLYRRGDCKDESEDSMINPPEGQSVPETGFVNQCFLAWEFVQEGQRSGTVSFYFEAYKVGGEYEVRYFYGDSRDGQGYKCGLQPGTAGYSAHCILRAKATSSVVTVVKSGPAESMQDIPGIESYTDQDDGSIYVSGF